jgi:hypothetical protein
MPSAVGYLGRLCAARADPVPPLSEFLTVGGVNGGHTWPGQPADPTGPKGRSTKSVDATKEILDFLDRHPKP